jgi:hypothetical protein
MQLPIAAGRTIEANDMDGVPLVFLCYKRREPQKGQQGSCRNSARAMV